MEAHWTEQSIEDYRFRIVSDFISQIEEKMESREITQDELAKILNKTKGRISQILNNPGNITFDNIVKLARALKIKVSLVAYEDDDPTNKKGPINSEIFTICWEKYGKPQDFWAFEDRKQKTATTIDKTIPEGCVLFIPENVSTRINKTANTKNVKLTTPQKLLNYRR